MGDDWEAAIIQANQGSTIIFGPGKYNGDCGIDLSKDLMLQSSTGLWQTEINCQNSARLFTIHDGATVSVVGLSVLSGHASDGGGCILVEERSTLLVQEARFAGCTSGENGGAIRLSQSSLVMHKTICEQSHADASGGCLSIEDGNASVSASSFANCSADEIGGAVHVLRGNFTGNHLTMSANHASGRGGGAAGGVENSTIKIEMSSFTDNVAGLFVGVDPVPGSETGAGGALYVGGDSTLELANHVRLQKNQGDWVGGAVMGETGSLVHIHDHVFIFVRPSCLPLSSFLFPPLAFFPPLVCTLSRFHTLFTPFSHFVRSLLVSSFLVSSFPGVQENRASWRGGGISCHSKCLMLVENDINISSNACGKHTAFATSLFSPQSRHTHTWSRRRARQRALLHQPRHPGWPIASYSSIRGGVDIREAAGVIRHRVDVGHNHAGGFCGGVWASISSSLTFEDEVRIHHNSAIMFGAVIVWTDCTVVVRGNVYVTDNFNMVPSTTFGGGGGIASLLSDWDIAGSLFVERNVISAKGGGIWWSFMHVTVSGLLRVADNEAMFDGGGICMDGEGLLTLNTAV
eukprot:1349561-Rhodomonas_salina.2